MNLTWILILKVQIVEKKREKKSYDSWKFELLIGYFMTEELVVVF